MFLFMKRRSTMSSECDLRPIKIKALTYPEPVRSLILSEPDSLPLQDFLAKSGVWERLLKMKAVNY